VTVTAATDYEPELVDALNLLIEDERASVEMEVALASGATEYAERETLARMGADDIRSCETLRAEMESADLPVTPQINGVVFEVLGAERYDDRLRAFAHHQRIVADRAADLLESNLEGEMRAALVGIVAAHLRHIEWATRRADEFATTRLMEFGARPSGQLAGADAISPLVADAGGATPEADAPEADAPEAGGPLTDIALSAEIQEVQAEEPGAHVEEAVAEEIPSAAAEEQVSLASAELPPLETSPEESATPEAPAEPPAPRPRRGRPRKTSKPAE
jgi:hypothetical protein